MRGVEAIAEMNKWGDQSASKYYDKIQALQLRIVKGVRAAA